MQIDLRTPIEIDSFYFEAIQPPESEEEDTVHNEMFEVFCQMHPIEAFHLDRNKFMDFLHKQNPYMQVEDVKKLIAELESEEPDSSTPDLCCGIY
jgi:hypothetical protein